MKPKFLDRYLVALTASAGGLLLPQVQADTIWLGGTSIDWANAANWNATLPAAGENIFISDTTAFNLTLDTSHQLGKITVGNTGLRITGFTFQTNAANTLTVAGGVLALGEFTGVGPTFRGNYAISADQTWQIGGPAGLFSDDRGAMIRGANDTLATVPSGSLLLTGSLTKTGSGQLSLVSLNASGPGNLIVDEGALKLNGGASQPLVIGGAGSIAVNNSASLYVVRNSGTFDLTRAIAMNGTSTVVFGGGAGTTIASPIAWNEGEHALNVEAPFTLSGAWSGSAAVAKGSAGALTLSGDNSAYTGTLTLNTGRLNLASAFGGGVTANAGAILSGESAIAGGLTLSDATLVIDPATAGSLSSGNLTLSGNSILTFASPVAPGATVKALAYSGTLTGDATFLDLPGGRTSYRDPQITIASGAVNVSLGNQARIWGNTVADWDVGLTTGWVEGDQMFFGGDAVTFGESADSTVNLIGELSPSAITIDSSGGYTFAAAAGNFLSGPTAITKNGAGTLTLGGVNTFNGPIAINAGTLRPTGNQALGANNNPITIAAGATLNTNGSMNANRDYQVTIAGSGSGGAGAIVNTGAAHNNGFRSITLSADATIGGSGRFDVRPVTAGQAALDLAGHTLTKTGANTVAIVDGVVTSPGTIEIQQGTLSFTRDTVAGAGSIKVASGATLMLENYTTGSFAKAVELNDSTLRLQGGNLAVGGGITLTGNPTFSTGINGTTVFTLTVNGAISGTGGIKKIDSGVLVMTANNTYQGGTSIDGGTLTPNRQISTVQVGAGGTTGTLGAGPVSLLTDASALVIDRSDDLTVANVISGIGVSGAIGDNFNPSALTKRGAGTLTLTAANTYTGMTLLTGGTVAVATNTALGSGVIDIRGGNLRSADASSRTLSNAISLSLNTTFGSAGTGELHLAGPFGAGGGTKIITVNNAITEISGVVSGGAINANVLTKAGPGTLIFSGNNTYGRLTTEIQAGVLQIGNGGTTGTLGGGGVLNKASLVFKRGENPVEYVVGNAISGTGSVTQAGADSVFLSGANTYTGDTIVSSGKLVVAAPFFDDASTIRIGADARLELFYEGTDTVRRLYIGDQLQEDGLYGSLTNAAADHKIAQITDNGLLLVQNTGTGSPYTTWAAANGIAGAAADLDSDGDGIANGIEFVIGGDPSGPDSNSRALLPTMAVTADRLEFTFRFADQASASSPKVEYSTNLTDWTEAVAGQGGVTLTRTDEGFGAGVDRVVVSLPKTLAGAGARLFTRLKITVD